MNVDPKIQANFFIQQAEKYIESGSSISSDEFRTLLKDFISHQQRLNNRITELEEVEAELNTAKSLYKEVFDQQPLGLYRIRVMAIDQWGEKSWMSSNNTPYVMEIASDRFCEILGKTREEFIANPFIISDVICAEDKESFVKKNEEANQKVIPFRWEGRLLINGNIVWIRLESTPRILENRDIQWTGVLIDITDRKRTEEALSDTLVRLEDIIVSAQIGIFEINFPSGEIIVNHVLANLLGYEHEELQMLINTWGKHSWTRLYHPDDIRKTLYAHLKHMHGEAQQFDNECRIRHKDGHWVWLHQQGKISCCKPDGSPLIGTAINTDISKRKMAEEALLKLNEELEERVTRRTAELEQLNASLQETEQKFRTLTDFTYDWEYWKSPEEKIIFMSPSAERMTGYTIREFEDCPELLDEIIYESDREIWEEHKRVRCHHLPEEGSMELTFRIVKKNGEIRWIGHVCRCISINGVHLGVRVSNRDITEKVNAENELLSVTVEVEERERNRFSSELHDGIGPLLAAIKLYFQWLADTDDPEKKKIIIEKGSHYIETAIQTTRELAHGLSSQYLVKHGYICCINDFVQRINETNTISIIFETNTQERFNDFIEMTLYRITMELLKNTLTYAQASKVNINFAFDTVKKNISVTYTDNGIGFDPVLNTKPTTGLGLMNIQQRVQILKGKIQIASSPGNGMVVEMHFPVEDGKLMYVG